MSFLGPTIRPRSRPVSIRISGVTTCLTACVCAWATHVANPAQSNSAQIQRMASESIGSPGSCHCAAVRCQHLPHDKLPPVYRCRQGAALAKVAVVPPTTSAYEILVPFGDTVLEHAAKSPAAANGLRRCFELTSVVAL